MEVNNYRQKFQEQGYSIVRGFFSPEEMTTLIEEIKSPESSKNRDILTKGTLEFYSNLFTCNQKIQAFISQPKLVDFLKPIVGPDFWVRWDQAVGKGPGAVTFPWHQDNAYNGFKDVHYQLWIALTKMTPDNGGLWLVPGSHKHLLPHKRVDNHHMEYQGTPENPVFVEAEAGDIVLFSSLILHSTTPNITQDTRWAYVVEYMSLDDLDPVIEPPYFVVARNGKTQPEFVPFYRGRLNPINWLKHWSSQREISKLLST